MHQTGLAVKLMSLDRGPAPARPVIDMTLSATDGSRMGLFSRLFGSNKQTPVVPVTRMQSTTRKTTVQEPFRIDNPAIGFLNLAGSAGEEIMKADRQLLAPLFSESRESSSEVPQCAVLFLYGDIEPTGKIAGRSESLRDIIKAAGAYIAVVASENPPTNYRKCLGPRNTWSANITFTIDRKGDKLPRFFAELFRQMYAGKSMLMAWVELAPQIPGHDHPDAPGTVMTAEAGHLVFGRGG